MPLIIFYFCVSSHTLTNNWMTLSIIKNTHSLLQLAVFAALLAVVFSCGQIKKEEIQEPVVLLKEPVVKYGLPVDSFYLVNGKVEQGQHLSSILNRNGISLGMIDTIARKSTPVFDVRKIREGNSYAIFQSRDTLQKALYFVYEKSPIQYVVFELFDSLRVYDGQKEVEYKLMTAQGVIEIGRASCRVRV